ncbi:MAG TPA: FtsX-like permease family protein [Ktedonobacteraceae bacterium]|nr:FtsX-like permease family protein [Ktedonobacteraceae bacterium]
MKTSMYFNYTTRSLLRGGQRTVLAVFCVAVGVMAIVALQLVGLMINNALTSNVRDANGGDVAVSSNTKPFTSDDLSFFNQLKASGTIISYTALANSSGSTSNSASITSGFSVKAVDPGSFPIVTPPTFTDPANGSISSLLTGNGVIVDKTVADQHNLKVGDKLDIHAGQQNQSPRILHVKIAGIVTDSGALAQSSGGVMLVSLNDYNAALPNAPVYYDTVYVTATDQAHIDQAVKAINAQFPLASTQTAADALKSQQSLVDFIKKFLEIAGLLALLIGGVGIVNTMQVLLSRRKTEIAMLKTTGYRRFDLYLLFGLEAGLLGLVGGIVGAAAATGVSLLVRNLVQQAFSINIPFLLDPLTIAGGVLIGLVTALIFGLMPIVQAANIRPLNVIRELTEGNRAGSIALTIGLLVILSILFCLLAIVILNDVILGISAVYGAFIFLGLLSFFFVLVVFIVSILPVPERFSIKYLVLLVSGVAVAVLIGIVLPTFGFLLLGLSLLGFVIVLLPRTWKSTTKIALRNVGRQRARTTTTLLALFVGIFTIGLILILGQNLRDKINNALATSLNYNVVTVAENNDASSLQSQLATIPGLTKHKQTIIASTSPLTISGQPIQDLLKGSSSQPSFTNLGGAGVLEFLSGVEGYDVANGQVPDTTNVTITDGRNLNASDAGTNNVLVGWQLVHLDPLKGHIKVGSTITLESIDKKTTTTLTIVGVYRSNGFGGALNPVLTTTNTVQALSPAGLKQSVFYMKIDSDKLGKALSTIARAAPSAFVFNLANIGDFIDQYLNYMLLTLSTIAGLSLLAGVIIIANVVALAMLERRRELGILKSVGYTSRSVLSEVLIEYGVIGGVGAFLALLLVTFAMNLLGKFVFKTSFDVNPIIVLVLIAGAALLAMVTAAIVAYGAVRVRPLEVLRYE